MATAPPPAPHAQVDRPDPRLPATHLDPVIAAPAIRLPGRLLGLGMFAVAAIIYAVVGYHVTIDQHVVAFDALDRLTRAYQVWYDDPPKLAAIGFSFPPITTLVLLPLALIKPLASGLVALPLTSAVFAGMTAVLVDRTLARCEMPAFLRIPIVLLYAANPMTVFYAGNGMSEAVYLALLALSLYCAVSWYETTQPRYLFAGGFGFALLLLTRYGFILWAVLLVLLIGVALLGRRAHRVEVEGSIVAFAAPAVYALVLWCLFNALIVGDPIGWLATNSSQGVNAAGIANAGNLSFLHILGRLISVTVGVFPLGLVAVPAALVVFFTRRDAMGLWLASLVILGVAIMGIHAVTAHREGLLTLRDAMPMALTSIVAAAWVFRSAGGLRMAVWGVTLVFLLLGLVTAWRAMESYPFQSLEQAAVRAVGDGADQEGTNSIGGFKVGIRSEAQMADFVKRNIHGRHAIFVDNAQSFGVILLSGRPRIFFDRVIKGDGVWRSVLGNPYGTVQYMLVAFNPRGGDLIRVRYPGLATGSQKGFTTVFRTARYILVRVPPHDPAPAVAAAASQSAKSQIPVIPPASPSSSAPKISGQP
ncbi:MAG: hypothetical protein QOH12_1430 [Solirubrobacteraceae bacterium]|jgi:hypothetical protein|nr:hypothetical protein [Solirubrobacteraceae bacterium]